MKKNIALMIESDGPGGAETIVGTLARGYREAGHSVFPVVHAGGPGWLTDRLVADGFTVFHPRLRRPVDPLSVCDYLRWMRRHRISAVHTHEFTTSVYGGLASRILSVPYVISMHGGTSYAQEERRRIALSYVARRARAVVGVSEATADALSSSLRLARKRIDVIPNGIETRPGSRLSGRKSLSVDEDRFVIVSVGNLYRVKGHDILVSAAAQLNTMHDLPNWKIFIAGRGDQEHLLRQQIQHHHLEDRVELLGLRSDVNDLLAGAELFVMPSRSEGLPVALIEAILSELPVVCSSVGGIPELLEDGRLGKLVPAEDAPALARSLASSMMSYRDVKESARLAKSCVSSRYSAQAMVSEYLQHLAPIT